MSDLVNVKNPNRAIVAPTSRLYNLILMKKPWSAIKRRAVQFPMDTVWKNSYGMTPLHISCCLRPPSDVVKALVKFNNGSTCSIPTNGKGNLPLHLACLKDASYDVIQILLRDGKSVVKNFDNNYPVNLLLDNFKHKQQGEFLKELNEAKDPIHFSQGMLEFWVKATLLLRAMLFENKGNREVPPTLPAYSPLLIQQSAFAVSQFEVSPDLKELALRVFHHHIESFPSICRILNKDGSYLLNLALENNVVDRTCIESMLKAYPNVLYILENKEYMYPFMLAATCNRKVCDSEDRNRNWLDSVYCILRASPDLVLDRTHVDFDEKPDTDGRKRGRENILYTRTPSDGLDDNSFIQSPDNRKKPKVIEMSK